MVAYPLLFINSFINLRGLPSKRRLYLDACKMKLRVNRTANISIETPLGIRLSKQKTSRKIDGSVALSFAVLAAVQNRRPPTPRGTATARPIVGPRAPYNSNSGAR